MRVAKQPEDADSLRVIVTPEQASAVILAGGFGTRIRHLLSDLPKPMAPVNGRPFVEWVVRYLARQGIGRVALSTGHLAETVENHFATRPVFGVELKCAPERSPMGTAGGFLNAVALSGWNSPAWLVLNGDSLALASIAPLLESIDTPGIAGALLGVEVEEASRFGTLEIDASGRLTGFHEKRPGMGIINAGVYVFTRTAVDLFPGTRPLSFERDVFPELARRGVGMKVCVTQAPFLDIGTPESLPLATAFVQQHERWFEV